MKQERQEKRRKKREKYKRNKKLTRAQLWVIARENYAMKVSPRDVKGVYSATPG